MLFEESPVKMIQIGVEEHDSEGAIKLQEGPKGISLIPCASLIHPFHRVFKGIEDIMEMHIDAAFQAREDFEQNPVHVAIDPTYMRGIHEQDIVGFQ